MLNNWWKMLHGFFYLWFIRWSKLRTLYSVLFSTFIFLKNKLIKICCLFLIRVINTLYFNSFPSSIYINSLLINTEDEFSPSRIMCCYFRRSFRLLRFQCRQFTFTPTITFDAIGQTTLRKENNITRGLELNIDCWDQNKQSRKIKILKRM